MTHKCTRSMDLAATVDLIRIPAYIRLTKITISYVKLMSQLLTAR